VNPFRAGILSTIEDAYGVAVADTIAFVAAQNNGMRIVNVSDPANPSEVGFYSTSGTAHDMAVVDTLVYLAYGSPGLYVINCADPANPLEIGSYNTPGSAYDVAVYSTLAYVADGGSGVRVLSIANPTNPDPVGYYTTPESVRGISQSNGYIIASCGGTGVQIYEYSPTGIEEKPVSLLVESSIPTHNEPNPFSHGTGTTIHYTLVRETYVMVNVYNSLGQRVETLIDEVEDAGSHQAYWTGTNAADERLPHGVYFYTIKTNEMRGVKKILLLN
jgi:hypothetical protein